MEASDQWFFHNALDQFGIIPRKKKGLRGILFAPLVHGGFSHLFANTGPLLVLGWFVLFDGVASFTLVTAFIWLTGGMATWVLGRSRSIHIGVSGIIFGYLGYLLLRGYLVQSFQAIALAIAAGVLYGGMLWGILPLRRRSSWEGHLFGFLSGGIVAYYLESILSGFD